MLDASEPGEEPSGVDLVDFDPDGELKVVAAMLYPYSDLAESSILERVVRMSTEDRLAVMKRYFGERRNRRHKPGRALERTDYRFDILSDYGAFRDLQRHRLATVEWQDLTPNHGYVRPTALDEAGLAEDFDEAMAVSADLWHVLSERYPDRASYAVSLAHRVRYVMQFNAREAVHLLELRSSIQGHPSYRAVAQQMHRLIAERAGHRAIAEMMTYVDHSGEAELERISSERRAESRRSQSEPGDAPDEPNFSDDHDAADEDSADDDTLGDLDTGDPTTSAGGVSTP
jgi:hypothetical protein